MCVTILCDKFVCVKESVCDKVVCLCDKRDKGQPRTMSARPAKQSTHRCNQVPPLPRKVVIHVAKYHTCHAMCKPMSPGATPATQRPTALPPTKRATRASPVPNATPATQSGGPCHQVPRHASGDLCRHEARMPRDGRACRQVPCLARKV